MVVCVRVRDQAEPVEHTAAAAVCVSVSLSVLVSVGGACVRVCIWVRVCVCVCVFCACAAKPVVFCCCNRSKFDATNGVLIAEVTSSATNASVSRNVIAMAPPAKWQIPKVGAPSFVFVLNFVCGSLGVVC